MFFINCIVWYLVINCLNEKINAKFSDPPLPIVMWHGMGDSCCNPRTMGYFSELIKSTLENVYIHSIQIGNNIYEVLVKFILNLIYFNLLI